MATLKNAAKRNACQRYLRITRLPLLLTPNKLQLSLPHE